MPGLYAEGMSSPSLASRRIGATSTTPIVLLHGFTQNADCWGPFGDELANNHPFVAIDLPGHGGSSAVHTDLPQTAALIASLIEPSVVLGYSLGGRVALHLALAQPELVTRLILIGATGGIETEAERATRRASDERLADHLEDIGVDAFLEEWLAQQLFASLSPEQAMRSIRATNSKEGLASSLRLCGTGTQESLWAQLHELSMPVLVLSGENDAKFTNVGHQLVESIGENATFRTIPHAGHSAHLENPDATAVIIETWLLEHP